MRQSAFLDGVLAALGGGGDDSDDGDGAIDAEIAVECRMSRGGGWRRGDGGGRGAGRGWLSALRDGLVRQPAVLRVYVAADLARMTSGAAADAGPYAELVAALTPPARAGEAASAGGGGGGGAD